jgi:hypothetical protein
VRVRRSARTPTRRRRALWGLLGRRNLLLAMSLIPREEHPARALVEALLGRTIVDATCDGEGVDDVRLQLDNGTVILIDSELDWDSAPLAERLGRPPWSRLVVRFGGDELWPHAAEDRLRSIGERPDTSDEERT